MKPVYRPPQGRLRGFDVPPTRWLFHLRLLIHLIWNRPSQFHPSTFTKETTMTTDDFVTYSITSAFLPKDIHPRRYRYWPSPRQLPSLERPRLN